MLICWRRNFDAISDYNVLYSFTPPVPVAKTNRGGVYEGKGYSKGCLGGRLFRETFVTPQCDFQGRLPLLQTTALEAPSVA